MLAFSVFPQIAVNMQVFKHVFLVLTGLQVIYTTCLLSVRTRQRLLLTVISALINSDADI